MRKIIRKVPLTEMWYEDNELFIRIKKRVGLYYLQVSADEFIDFLADLYHKDSKNGRVFKFVGIRKSIPSQTQK
ncbi:MAG: hypothetical protein AABY22_34245 [Nanoarchaeota archaeon]